MKKLRIIDKANSDKNQWDILIQFEHDEAVLSEHHTINPADFLCNSESLNWYYTDYLLKPLGQPYKKAQKLTSSLIDQGKSLASKLFTGDILTALEKQAINDLVVSIESASADFFAFPWETLSLTHLDKPLSHLVAAFVRTEKSYGDTPKYLGFGADNPLTILFVSPRPQDCGDNPLCCAPDAMIRSLLELGDAVKLELLATQSMTELAQRLEKSAENPIHLLHFNGYVTNAADKLHPECVVFESIEGSADFVSYQQCAQLISKYNIETVFLDVAPCINANSSPAHTDIPTTLAQILQSNGITNIITTRFGHYTVYAQRFYSIVLSLLATAESLAKSVVKACDIMCENPAQAVLTIQPVNFLDWPLVNHYSTHDSILFSAPISLRPLSENPRYQEMANNIIAFRQDILASGFLGRSHETRQVDRILARNTIAVVTGNDGVGKTHFVHHYMFWHMYAKKSLKALYFDFRAHHYNKKLLLQIIYDVLDDKSLDMDAVHNLIQQQSYLFVLDNMDAAQFSDAAEKEELLQFLVSLSQGASNIIIVNAANEPLTADDDAIILKGLNAYDRRQYACSILRQKKYDEAEEMPGYFDLIDALDGHPFLMQILLAMLGQQGPDEIEKRFFAKLQQITHSHDIYSDNALVALFDYGWDHCDTDCKKILLAFKNCQGYLTEGMVINADKKAQHSGKSELFELLKVDKNYSLAKAFAQACKIGLFHKKEFGYEIHPKAKLFLHSKQSDNGVDEKNHAALEIAISKLLIAELQMLYAFIKQHPDKTLYQIIIQNNSRWFDALTVLWQAHAYSVFNEGIDYLCQILSPVGLLPVLQSWCFARIKQQKFAVAAFGANEDYTFAWFKVASYALEMNEAIADNDINEYVTAWRNILEQIERVEIFNYAMMFLEKCYRKKGDWQARKALSEQAVNFYQQRQAYENVIISMRSLAKCEEALGNLEQAQKIEQNILEDIPFDTIGPGAKQESMLAIAMNKVHRKEYEQAEVLIQQLKASPESERYHFMADIIIADILFKREQHIEALDAYANLWKTMMQKKSGPSGQNENALVATRLKQLATVLGDDVFTKEFKRIAPDMKIPFEQEA